MSGARGAVNASARRCRRIATRCSSHIAASIAPAAFRAPKPRRCFQFARNARPANVAADAFEIAICRQIAHLQTVKRFGLVDENFQLLALPLFSTRAHGSNASRARTSK